MAQIPVPSRKGDENSQQNGIEPVPSDQGPATGPTRTQGPEEKKPAKEAKPEKSRKSEPKPAETAADGPLDVSRLDMRVGLIISAKKHPDADSLYVEEVEVGEEKPRTVVSGLVKFVPLEEVQFSTERECRFLRIPKDYGSFCFF